MGVGEDVPAAEGPFPHTLLLKQGKPVSQKAPLCVSLVRIGHMTSTCRKGGWEADLFIYLFIYFLPPPQSLAWEVGQAIGNRNPEPQCSLYPVHLTPLKYFVAVRPLIYLSVQGGNTQPNVPLERNFNLFMAENFKFYSKSLNSL